jgi:hypothetical protein
LALSIVFLGLAHLGADCVDGATPDCSDPKIQCGVGPITEAGPDTGDSSVTLKDATPADAGTDADADAADAADADGG